MMQTLTRAQQNVSRLPEGRLAKGPATETQGCSDSRSAEGGGREIQETKAEGACFESRAGWWRSEAYGGE